MSKMDEIRLMFREIQLELKRIDLDYRSELIVLHQVVNFLEAEKDTLSNLMIANVNALNNRIDEAITSIDDVNRFVGNKTENDDDDEISDKHRHEVRMHR